MPGIMFLHLISIGSTTIAFVISQTTGYINWEYVDLNIFSDDTMHALYEEFELSDSVRL